MYKHGAAWRNEAQAVAWFRQAAMQDCRRRSG
jgi:TPR repeat protein